MESEYELSKMPNGLRSQQRLPLGAWDSYMQIANVVDKAVDGQVEPVIVWSQTIHWQRNFTSGFYNEGRNVK